MFFFAHLSSRTRNKVLYIFFFLEAYKIIHTHNSWGFTLCTCILMATTRRHGVCVCVSGNGDGSAPLNINVCTLPALPPTSSKKQAAKARRAPATPVFDARHRMLYYYPAVSPFFFLFFCFGDTCVIYARCSVFNIVYCFTDCPPLTQPPQSTSSIVAATE